MNRILLHLSLLFAFGLSSGGWLDPVSHVPLKPGLVGTDLFDVVADDQVCDNLPDIILHPVCAYSVAAFSASVPIDHLSAQVVERSFTDIPIRAPPYSHA